MVKCNKQVVPKSCCYLSFTNKNKNSRILAGVHNGGTRHANKYEYAYSEEPGDTVRGEGVIIDYDKNGAIIGIELIGGKKCRKRCQEG